GALANSLVNFFKAEGANSVVDFGCGEGKYVRILLDNGITCRGYDGHPDTYEMSGGIAGVKDLSKPFYLGKKFDWVMSIEVGEHLPKEFEAIFIKNLTKHARHGIVLSWALPGQGGFGHFNEQSNAYIKELLAGYGFEADEAAERELRNGAECWWLKNTVMVFRKVKKTEPA
ncbi:MAG: methyltransferase domain-containing protein, partial [Chlamydiia bacterium]